MATQIIDDLSRGERSEVTALTIGGAGFEISYSNV